MKFFQRLSLAYYNLVRKIKFSFKMIMGIMLILVIMVYSRLFIKGIEAYYEKLFVDMARNNNIYVRLNVSGDGMILENDKELLQQIQSISEFSQPIVDAGIVLPKNSENDSKPYIVSDRVSMIQDDSQITMKSITSDIFDICYLVQEGSFFSQMDKNSFSYYFPDESLFLAGNDVQEYGDIVVSNDFLSQFGIEKYDNLVGKNFSVCIDGKPYLKSVRLVGVYNHIISEIDRTKNYSSVIYCGGEQNMKVFHIEELSARIQVEKFEDANLISQKLDELNGAQNIFYNRDNAEILIYVNNIRHLIYYIIFLVMGLVIIALFISLCATLYNRVLENAQYYAMMRAIGLKYSHLASILHMEQLLLMFVAIFFTLPIDFFGLYLVNYLLRDILESGLMLRLSEFVKTEMICVSIIYIGLFIVTFVFIMMNQKRQIGDHLKHVG